MLIQEINNISFMTFFKWYLYLFHGVCCEAIPMAYREFCVKDMTKTMAQEGSVKD